MHVVQGGGVPRDDLGGDLALAAGLVREHGLAGHVANREDAGEVGPHAVVDGDLTTCPKSQTQRGGIDATERRLPADGDEHGFRNDLAAAVALRALRRALDGEGTWWAILLVTVVAQSFPTFWLGIMLVVVFSVILKWLPAGGTGSWQHVILPSVTLASFVVAFIARMTLYFSTPWLILPRLRMPAVSTRTYSRP